MTRQRLILFIIILLISPLSIARNDKQKKTSDGFHDHIHSNISRKIEGLGLMMDSLFADKKIQENFDNETSMRIFLNMFKLEGENWSTTPDFKLRLQLPRTKRRFQLIIDSNRPGQSGDNSDVITGDATRQEQNDVNAAVRFLTKIGDFWNAYFDTGVRFNVPPRAFARAGITRNFKLQASKIVFSHEFNYFTNDGMRAITSLNLNKELSKKLFFQFINRSEWEHNNSLLNMVHGPSLIYQIDKKSVLANYALTRLDNETALQVNSYDLISTYRRQIYKNWLFFEVSPILSFPRLNNWKSTPSILFKLETAFGRTYAAH